MPGLAKGQVVKDEQEMVVDQLFFQKGQKKFRAPGRNLGGTRWGVWFYLLDGAKAKKDQALVFGIKESQEAFELPSQVDPATEKESEKRRVWGQPFTRKELETIVDEEGGYELEIFSPQENNAITLLERKQKREVRAFGVHSTEDQEEERVKILREAIFQDYEGKVLASEVPKDPPNQGPFRTAHI